MRNIRVFIVLGIAALGLYQAGEAAGFIGSLIGAIILLVIYGLITRNRA